MKLFIVCFTLIVAVCAVQKRYRYSYRRQYNAKHKQITAIHRWLQPNLSNNKYFYDTRRTLPQEPEVVYEDSPPLPVIEEEELESSPPIIELPNELPSPPSLPVQVSVEKIIKRIFDYVYPLVLRKCLMKVTHASLNDGLYNDLELNAKMTQVAYPFVQVFSLEKLKQMMNEYLSHGGDDVKSTCAYKFDRVKQEMLEWADLLVNNYKDSSAEEFRADNERFNKFHTLMSKESLPYFMFRYAFELERNGEGVYRLMCNLEPFVDKYIRFLESRAN